MMSLLLHLLFGVSPLLRTRALDTLLLLARSFSTLYDLLLMVSEVSRVWVRLTGRLLRKLPFHARISPQLPLASGRHVVVPMLGPAVLRDSVFLARGPYQAASPFSGLSRSPLSLVVLI